MELTDQPVVARVLYKSNIYYVLGVCDGYSKNEPIENHNGEWLLADLQGTGSFWAPVEEFQILVRYSSLKTTLKTIREQSEKSPLFQEMLKRKL